jgi:UDP-glucose:(heptosyl)LPS alpha-1,3-glucosyltransferase
VTVRNGVDTSSFRPEAAAGCEHALRASLGVEDSRLLAIFVGGEWERKGLAAAIEALAQAPEWHLLVVGPGDQRHFAAHAASLGLGERVHFAGVRADVPALYPIADAFVLPTSYETFSLATYEAAASGLPLLATPVNGVRELIVEGVNGYFISRRPEEIAARLRELGEDGQLRRRLGDAARQSSLEFGWERSVEAYERLYVG